MKIIIIGIFFMILNTLTGSIFDLITKLLSTSHLLWYHYYSIGNMLALFLFLIFLNFSGGIKKHLVFDNKINFFLPLFRGITFIPIAIIVYYVLKTIDLSVFTTILMMTPFFVFIFSSLLQKEKIKFINWIILSVGFIGTIMVIQPSFENFTLGVLLTFIVPAYNALTNVIVSKYSNNASAYGFTFYHLLPLGLLSSIMFMIYPINLDIREIILISLGGIFIFLAILFWTTAFHIAGKFSAYIIPFIFTQIIWASTLGFIFFNENLDIISISGIIMIIVSGTITIYKSPKIIN